jgi:23S rRNA (adenine2503-C2)-methyltransferase
MQSDIQNKVYLLDLSFEELNTFVQQLGLEKFRGKQIFRGIYADNLVDFSRLTTISKALREELNRRATIRSFKLGKSTRSPFDGTTKFLWELPDGMKIESVIIYEGKRITYCISSQVGCALDCKFCATGKMGFLRNLSSGEIVEQVLVMKEIDQQLPSNIVFMGMGEPLLNLKNVLKACYLLSDPEGLVFTRKKITISTSGIVTAIRNLADWSTPFSLAVSLNAVFQEKRVRLMPVASLYPLSELEEAIYYYVRKLRRRVTFEYILIHGINDAKPDADRLLKFTARIPCKINLIPCNSTDPEFQPPASERINWFRDYLDEHRRTVTVRLRKGWDIQAACGQLYSQHATRIGTKIASSVKIKKSTSPGTN